MKWPLPVHENSSAEGGVIVARTPKKRACRKSAGASGSAGRIVPVWIADPTVSPRGRSRRLQLARAYLPWHLRFPYHCGGEARGRC